MGATVLPSEALHSQHSFLLPERHCAPIDCILAVSAPADACTLTPCTRIHLVDPAVRYSTPYGFPQSRNGSTHMNERRANE